MTDEAAEAISIGASALLVAGFGRWDISRLAGKGWEMGWATTNTTPYAVRHPDSEGQEQAGDSTILVRFSVKSIATTDDYRQHHVDAQRARADYNYILQPPCPSLPLARGSTTRYATLLSSRSL